MRVARPHATCPWLEGGDATGPCAPAVAGPFCCKMFSPRLGWLWRLVRRAPNIHEVHTHPAAMRGVSSRVLASHPDGPSSRAQPGGSHGKAVAPERREGVCESCQTTPRRPGPGHRAFVVRAGAIYQLYLRARSPTPPGPARDRRSSVGTMVVGMNGRTGTRLACRGRWYAALRYSCRFVGRFECDGQVRRAEYHRLGVPACTCCSLPQGIPYLDHDSKQRLLRSTVMQLGDKRSAGRGPNNPTPTIMSAIALTRHGRAGAGRKKGGQIRFCVD